LLDQLSNAPCDCEADGAGAHRLSRCLCKIHRTRAFFLGDRDAGLGYLMWTHRGSTLPVVRKDSWSGFDHMDRNTPIATIDRAMSRLTPL
jgi:hypothetical protein